MKTKTDELLYSLFWCMDILANPTSRNLTDSYECWAYRRGFLFQIDRLVKNGLVERDPRVSNDRLYRLTDLGRLRALRGRDPQARWARPWDGLWRLVVFDVPISREAYRHRLRRYLTDRGFGCLQGSVWVTPDPMEQERQHLADGDIDVNSLVLLEGRTCAGETDEKIVAGAWNFDAINSRYKKYLRILREQPAGNVSNESEARAFRAWGAAERYGWWLAIRADPLLPGRILPAGYLGQEAWKRRIQSLREAGRKIRDFHISTV